MGDVIGDMTSRRGRVGGMDPAGGTTTIHVEVPLAEVLTYAPDLNSMTGGRGDYQMSLLRYEEVPAHVAQQVIAAASKDKELARRKPPYWRWTVPMRGQSRFSPNDGIPRPQ